MKAKNFFEMTNVELNDKVAELKAELFNLRFKHATNRLPNPLVLVETRRDIARAKTVLRQRELGISEEPLKGKKTVVKKAKE
jgi:ribosomal protein L29